ncbi:mutS protein homolog 5 [Aplysia californica]|uniref:MutS protein homolog 5 n=1 Tax=Aplysia californica TaxID=6500 RepID=A0ABM1W564_APLCA|nr:mutS protein homolog 5 [Aplysia californica]
MTFPAMSNQVHISHPFKNREFSHDARISGCSAVDEAEEAEERRQNLSDVSMSSEVYMSIVWHSGHLAVAHYDLTNVQIYVLPDVRETDDFSLIKHLLQQIQPSVIVVSSIQDSRLLTCIKKIATDMNSTSPGSNGEAYRIQFLPRSDFNYEVSKRRIIGMSLPSVPGHFTDEERRIHFSSLIPLDSVNMVRCVGGLLRHLEKMRVGVELEDASTRVPVLGFKVFSLEDQVQIDMLTYTALNIFHKELHPSAFKLGASGSKEGLSLFGILNRCKSANGTRRLRHWFLRPIKNAALLRQRHDAVSFFLTPRNLEVVSCLHGCLKHVKFIPNVLVRMSKAKATIGDWIALSKTLYHAVYIGDICRSQVQTVEIFRKISATFTDDLHRCANLVFRTLDFEESKRAQRFVVKIGVDDALDAKKRTYEGLPSLMNQVAREELTGLSSEISECFLSYIPEVGYLLVIPKPEGKPDDADHTIEGLQFKFVSNGQLYYKSAKTLEMDRLLGDTKLEILDVEVSIMHGLQSRILENTQLILEVMDLTAELDCLMALATCAGEFGYVCPSLVQEDIIDVTAGRHPLQELCCSPFVPNDTSIGTSKGKVKLITGPNACGKSVYLKQVALIVFLAHIGSFVPAEKASIGPVDRIFSRIKSLESVSGVFSTFMQDLIQVSEALRSASSSSLIVIDEFGKGTESTDGLSLLTAVLKFWVDKGPDCPRALVSTHFHGIVQHSLLPRTEQLQLQTMDTVMNGAELVFLYQLKEGHATSSYACNIAALVGIPEHVIRRGKQVSALLGQYRSVPHVWDGDVLEQQKRYEEIVCGFMKLNLDSDDLHAFLQGFILPLFAKPSTKSGAISKEDSNKAQSGQQKNFLSKENPLETFAPKPKHEQAVPSSIFHDSPKKAPTSKQNCDSVREVSIEEPSVENKYCALSTHKRSTEEQREGLVEKYKMREKESHKKSFVDSVYQKQKVVVLEEFAKTPVIDLKSKSDQKVLEAGMTNALSEAVSHPYSDILESPVIVEGPDGKVWRSSNSLSHRDSKQSSTCGSSTKSPISFYPDSKLSTSSGEPSVDKSPLPFRVDSKRRCARDPYTSSPNPIHTGSKQIKLHSETGDSSPSDSRKISVGIRSDKCPTLTALKREKKSAETPSLYNTEASTDQSGGSQSSASDRRSTSADPSAYSDGLSTDSESRKPR